MKSFADTVWTHAFREREREKEGKKERSLI
jgi:hypothetical protein